VTTATRVFKPEVVEGYEWVQPVEQADFDAVYQLDGSPVAVHWTPIRVRTLQVDDRGLPLRRADLPWLGGHALVFREHAYRAAAEALAAAGEFLELDLVDGSDRLWLYNVCCVADVLDEEASDLVRFPSTGRVMKVDRHVFDADAVANLVAFRVPQARSLFLTGDVVDTLVASGMVGVEFALAWEKDSPESA
jgi:hypothetical protein